MMEIKPLVLIVEDERPICHFMTAILTANGYHVVSTGKGQELPSLVSSHCPDLVILDLGLPDIDGSEALSALREWSSVPVVVVSARDSERDKVKALDTGADDYITKPFGTAELLARIRTAIRHVKIKQEGETQAEVYTIGGLCIDSVKLIITLDSREIHFTPIEYKIIELLARNRGRVLTYDMILRSVWGPYFTDNQTLRVNMANIRRKIEKNPAEPRYIKTEIGVGYRMAEE
jgi:two-component system, OmpR family, KDP operon response regulator KdpE